MQAFKTNDQEGSVDRISIAGILERATVGVRG